MHAVHKEHSTTTKLHVVFDASAKSASGVSLKDTPMVRPTVHPPLSYVLLHFLLNWVAFTEDTSKMYRVTELDPQDKDLHWFVWQNDPSLPLHDYRMDKSHVRSISFYICWQHVCKAKLSKSHSQISSSLAAAAADKTFYIDDCLSGAPTIPDAVQLQEQLQNLFAEGGFLLCKWLSSESAVLQGLPEELKDPHSMLIQFDDNTTYTKTLGIEWNANSDYFQLTITELPPLSNVTKWSLVSDIAKTFDILGWFSPTSNWKSFNKCGRPKWDGMTLYQTTYICTLWKHWRSELHLLQSKHMPRCNFDKKSEIIPTELHGFSDAPELAYAAVV